MKITHLTVALFLLLLLGFTAAASAEPLLRLDLVENSGFTLKNGIHGTYTMNALFIENGTISNAAYVEFYLNDQLQKNDTTAPFSWILKTIDYEEGTYTLKVLAYNTLGESATVEQQLRFVGFPVISVVGAVLFASVVFAFLLVISWFYIKDKAQKRTAKGTLSG